MLQKVRKVPSEIVILKLTPTVLYSDPNYRVLPCDNTYTDYAVRTRS